MNSHRETCTKQIYNVLDFPASFIHSLTTQTHSHLIRRYD
jgi:hypothetical protein